MTLTDVSAGVWRRRLRFYYERSRCRRIRRDWRFCHWPIGFAYALARTQAAPTHAIPTLTSDTASHLPAAQLYHRHERNMPLSMLFHADDMLLGRVAFRLLPRADDDCRDMAHAYRD